MQVAAIENSIPEYDEDFDYTMLDDDDLTLSDDDSAIFHTFELKVLGEKN